MTGLFRILLFILVGYILVKVVRFVFSVFTSVKARSNEEKVSGTTPPNSKINKKDVIEAQFEEIEVDKDKSSNK